MSLDELEPAEKDLVTLAFGVDSMAGGDALHESGAQHMIIDTWTSGMEAPTIYHDPIAAEMREKGGADAVIPEAVSAFTYAHRLHSLPGLIRLESKSLPQERSVFFNNLTNALEVMLQTLDPNVQTPSFDQRYRTVTMEPEVKVIDPTVYRVKLQRALANAGYDDTVRKKGLREAYLKWELDAGFVGEIDKGKIDGHIVEAEFNEMIGKLLQAARERLFPHLSTIGGTKLEDIEFGGFKFKPVSNVHFTGSSIYSGGGTETPELNGLLEYNVDHPLTRAGLLHLAAHEAMPGHYLNSAFSDLLWREGRLPFEATMGTMCTSSTIFQEGWAENALKIIYGSDRVLFGSVQQDFGVDPHDLQVALAVSALQNVAKHNVSIKHQRDGASIEEIRRHVAEDCVQPDSIVEKMARGWASHPIIGPMYGPAYLIGEDAVRAAIERAGPTRVAKVGLQLEGRLADLETFHNQVYRI
jgi:hypothetical protein